MGSIVFLFFVAAVLYIIPVALRPLIRRRAWLQVGVWAVIGLALPLGLGGLAAANGAGWTTAGLVAAVLALFSNGCLAAWLHGHAARLARQERFARQMERVRGKKGAATTAS